jgi:hypothetical protein
MTVAVRVSTVAASVFRSRDVFVSDRDPGFSFGSPSYVAKPAAAAWPLARSSWLHVAGIQKTG